jgi:peptidyl-prolyl cis-trans isomerase SurA
LKAKQPAHFLTKLSFKQGFELFLASFWKQTSHNQQTMKIPAFKPFTVFGITLGAILLANGMKAFAQGSTAASAPVLFEVSGGDLPTEQVRTDEFSTLFNKNNFKKTAPTRAEWEEYLDLYVKFKLKVREAIRLGMDTTTRFKEELQGYRNQLAQPYLRDKETGKFLLDQAFERSQLEVRAAHIMVRVDENASPADSLAAYHKAVALRQDIVEGKDFSEWAKAKSDDPSASDNGGDLGYFSVFRMIYPFEEMAFNTPVGALSPVFRTQYGYHFLKVLDRRKARGEIRVAHLLIKSPSTDNDTLKTQAKAKVDALMSKLQAGESFEALVKQHSEDPSTSDKGGVLPFFGTGRMIPDFEEAAFGLAKDGDLSAPVQTPYGWHILKRLEYRPVPGFDQAKGDLELKIARDTRANQNTDNLILKLKSEYQFTENKEALEAVFASVVDSMYRKLEWKAPTSWAMKANQGNWDPQRISQEKAGSKGPGPKHPKTKAPSGQTSASAGPAMILGDTVVHRYGEVALKQSDLAMWLEEEQKNAAGADPAIHIHNVYKARTNKAILAYEDSRLENKYPAFAALMKEYREGILLFDLMDKKVWSMAMSDSDGLQKFFEGRSNQYQWKDRTDAEIYTCLNEDVAKEVRKAVKKGKMSPEEISKTMNAQNPLNVKVISSKYEVGTQAILDSLPRKQGLIGPFERNNQWIVVRIKDLIPAGPKKLNEARGQLTSDYQTELESRWIAELRLAYPVVINDQIFKSLLPSE